MRNNKRVVFLSAIVVCFILLLGSSGKTSAQYIDNGDGTVTDTMTGLMWQKATDNVNRTWEHALSYSESLDLGGYMDWRLPNIRELQSIVVDSLNPPFDPLFIVSSTFWSSTTLPTDGVIAWMLQSNGQPLLYPKNRTFGVRCVRGGP